MWIKICGITSLEDAEAAIAVGADALGFVFAESPRRVAPEDVHEIAAKLPETVEKIGVFVDASIEEMAVVQRTAGLTGVQVHGAGGDVRAHDLEGPFGRDSTRLRIVQVVRYHADPDRFAMELRKLHRRSDCEQDAVLVDTWAEGKQGGTGRSFDWPAARDSFLREAPHLRLIAAGGLNSGNVREAIHTLRPWGIDVSSGVESAPGKKDAELVRAFIRAARAAEMELEPAAILEG